MSSLDRCLLRFVHGADARTLRDAAQEYAARGKEDQAANVAAIKDKLHELKVEENRIIDLVRAAATRDGFKPTPTEAPLATIRRHAKERAAGQVAKVTAEYNSTGMVIGDHHNGIHQYVLTPMISGEPGFRVTQFVNGEPIGHAEYDNLAEAAHDLVEHDVTIATNAPQRFAAEPGFELKGETLSEAKIAAALKAHNAKQAAKRDAAPPPESFVLTGSDRQRDLTPGQRDIFAAADTFVSKALDNLTYIPEQNNAKAQLARERFIRELTQAGRLNVMAASINVAMLKTGHVSLLGQRVTSNHDMATVAQVARTPLTETLRYEFIKDGLIVHETAVGSRLPATGASWAGDDWAAFHNELRRNLERTKADGFRMLHNHPSGDAGVSPADIQLTKDLARLFPDKFLSHVVIDTDQYSVIDANGNTKLFHADFGGVAPHDPRKPAIGESIVATQMLGSKVTDPKHLFAMGRQLHQRGQVSLIGISSTGHVVGIADLSLAKLGTDFRTKGTITRFTKSSGAGGGVFIANLPETHADIGRHLVKQGILRDAITDTNGSMRARMVGQGEYPSRHWVNVGRLEPRGRIVAEKAPPYQMDQAAQRQIDSPDFKKWFGDSKVVTPWGDPDRMYHATQADFKEFERAPHDIGFHFGTVGQAYDRQTGIQDALDAYNEGTNVMPVYLSIKDPLRLPDMGGWYAGPTFNEALRGVFPESKAEIEKLKTTAQIRNFIKSKGYDGVVYQNKGESNAHPLQRQQYEAVMAKAFGPFKARADVDKDWAHMDDWPEAKAYYQAEAALEGFVKRNYGMADSYIAFDKTQVKSAIGNIGRYDLTKPSIVAAPESPYGKDLFGDAPQVRITTKKRIRTVAPELADLLDIPSTKVDTAAKDETNEPSQQPIRGNRPEVAPGKPAAGLPAAPGERTTGSLFGTEGEGRGGPGEPVAPEKPGERVGAGGVGAGSGRPGDKGQPTVPEPRGTTGPGPGPTRPRPKAFQEPGRPGVNFRITEPDQVGAGGWKQKHRDNVAAISLLKQIEAENRLATPEEQQALAKYVGWGGMKNAFFLGSHETVQRGLDEPTGYHARQMEMGQANDWAKERRELYGTLTKDEYNAARASLPNAHYTAPAVISAMWNALDRMGYKGGRTLEPAMGIGHFFGLMPDRMRAKSTLAGVELDHITARIAHQLYQKADVRQEGFEAAQFPNGFFDVAISNFPFGDFSVHDPAYKAPKLLIHDYFFAKSLDRVRPGGIVAAITSDGTMDKLDGTARGVIAKKGEFLGAIRLPNDAFKKNAGTEVTTDIIFLRKWPEDVKLPAMLNAADKWGDTTQVETDDGPVTINKYFKNNPDMILGKLGRQGSMYGHADTAVTSDGRDLGEALAGAVAKLPADAIKPRKPSKVFADPIPAEPGTKQGALVVKNGKVYQNNGGMMLAQDLPVDKVSAFIGLRDGMREHLALQSQTEGDTPEFLASRKALNAAWRSFVAKHGYINDRKNTSLLWADSDGPLVAGLEKWDKDTGRATPSDMLSQRTLHKQAPVESVDGAEAALLVSLNERGGVDLEHMAKISGLSEAELVSELEGRIYQDPVGADWQSADAYLSGNVRTKLRDAESAAKSDPRYEANVKALKAVIPADLPASRTRIRLGQSWIPQESMNDFANELLGAQSHHGVKVSFSPLTSTWVVSMKYMPRGPEMDQMWGTHDVSADKILAAALNQTKIKVYTGPSDARVVDPEATAAALDKIDAVKAKFESWWKEDDTRREQFLRLYNDEWNSIRNQVFDGSHMTLPGSNPAVQLRANVRDGAWRIVTSPNNVLLGHAVGAGKTFTMVSGSMERKRLGLSNKPAHIVLKATLDQYAREWRQLYPNSNLLVTRNEDLASPQARKTFAARVATGNWDGIIMSHEAHERIPMSAAYQAKYVQERLDELEQAILEANAEKANPRLIKQLEKAKLKLQAKLKTLLASSKKDELLTFEQLGIDALFVDEAHKFKNLEVLTKMSQVPGIAGRPSQRATDMLLKTRYINEINNQKGGVVFATGTPVTNTMGEVYTMQRFLGGNALKASNLDQFDNWAAQFGDIVTTWEMTPDGSSYKAKARFGRFVNVGDLVGMFHEFADIKTAEMLKLPVPEIEGGRPRVITSPKNPLMDEFVAGLVKRAEWIRANPRDRKTDNMLKITNDGRMASIDLRLVMPNAPDLPDSKVNKAVAEILKEWKEGKDKKLTQLVFSDRGVHGAFNIYDDMRAKLIKGGIPAKEIAFMHDQNTDAKKAAVQEAVRQGKVRVLFGSTENTGTGVNVQPLLVALHHIDVPQRPSDVEQRNGRIVRQGNKNAYVKVNHYIGEGFDAFQLQTLERKDTFIRQFMNGDRAVREMEDIDDRPLTYAELKAIATGNPLIMEKAQVDSDVARISGQASRHEDTQHALLRQATQREELARGLRDHAARAAEDEKELVSTRGDAFSAVIGDRKYADRTEAANALAGAMSRLSAKEAAPTPIGKMGGMDIGAQKRPTLVTGVFTHDLYALGRNTYHTGAGDSADGNLQRLENLVASIAGEAGRARAEAETNAEQAAKARKAAIEPFADTAKLEKLRARQAEIDNELGIGRDDHSAVASASDEAPYIEPEVGEAPPAAAAPEPPYGEGEGTPPPEERREPPGGPPPNARGFRERAGRGPTEPEQEARRKAFGYTMYEGVAPQERKSVRGAILDTLKKLLLPSTRGALAKLQAGIMRANLARMARDGEVAGVQFKKYAAAFNKLSQADQVAFINRYERGEEQPTPALREAADAMREFNRQLREQLQAMGKLTEFNENYLGRIWNDPEAKVNSVFARRPLEGSKNFLKRRVYEYFSEGLAAGLKPLTYNPIEMMLLKGIEQRRYIYGQKIFAEMKAAGLVKLVPYDGVPPEGWTALNDKIARSPQGKYYAPDQAATLFNNHLSPGLRGNAAYDAYHKAGMLLNSAQLGLSMFHAGFTTLDSMVSKAALGVQQISRGQMFKGFGNVLQAFNPVQPFLNAYKGDRLLRAYLGELHDPSLAPIVEALVQGGGRARMDEFYRNATLNAFKQALNRNDKLGVLKHLLPSILDRINAPIFEQLVPRQKLGIFFDMAKDWIERNPNATVEQKRAAMGKFWDSVDNRLGQLAYDNVFWNRTLKDMLMVSVRSVGWNLGTFRELGGGLTDVRHILKDKELSSRTAYAIALPFVAGILGAMTQYMYTGSGPDELKDYFFPKTGRKRPDGTDDRLSLPSYMKDIFEYGHDISGFLKYGANPTQTLTNKLHPMLGTVSQMLNNQDFFGGAIRSPGDPAVAQLTDEAKYLTTQIAPFALRNYLQQAKTKQEEPTAAGYLSAPSLIGITPSPGYITKNAQQTEAAALGRQKDSLISKFRQEIRDGAPPGDIAKRAFAAGLRLPEVSMIVRQGLTPQGTPSRLGPRHLTVPE